jgi:hypothetical protein
MHDKRSMTLARALRVLDLGPAATLEEIKQAYRDLVRVWHPDRFEGDTRLREKAAWKLSEINAAYGLLEASSLRGTGAETSTLVAGARCGTRAPAPMQPVAEQIPFVLLFQQPARRWLVALRPKLVVSRLTFALFGEHPRR